MTDAPVTLAECMAALPRILAAPKEEGAIDHLCFRPGRNLRTFPQTLRLTRAEGIPGDRWATEPWQRLPDGAPDPDLQVSILPLRVLNLIWRNRSETPHPGDTIVADLDLGVDNLPPGSLLQAGTAQLRVSSYFNDGCVKWKTRHGQAAKDFIVQPGHAPLRLRGIICAVEADGDVRCTDTLRVLRRGPGA
jgi:hypothetical protein